MFIDFEGIDGSGKTTLSNLLATRLRRLGHKVAHAREGGELQSPIARRIRELTRDSRLLEMGARTEFFLNVARDAQQLEEVICPGAGARRGVHQRSLPVLAAGAERRRSRPARWRSWSRRASWRRKGIWPDLVILVDVEPDLARLRKRLGKLKDGRSSGHRQPQGPGGRGARRARARGLPGAWRARIRRAGSSSRTTTSRCGCWSSASWTRWWRGWRGASRRCSASSRRAPVVPGPVTVDSVEERFFQALDSLEVREPLARGVDAGRPAGAGGAPAAAGGGGALPGAGRAQPAGAGGRGLVGAARAAGEGGAGGRGRQPGPRALSPRAMALREQLYPLAPGGGARGPQAQRQLRGVGPAGAGAAGSQAGGRCSWASPAWTGATAWSVRELGVQKKLYSEVARSLTGLKRRARG